MTTAPRIVILGAGFAALTAVREMRKRSPEARLTLVAPKAEFVYLPSLIWIPSGLRKGSDLILPLDRFLKDHQVEFVAGRVSGLRDGGRTANASRTLASRADVVGCSTWGAVGRTRPSASSTSGRCQARASAAARSADWL